MFKKWDRKNRYASGYPAGRIPDGRSVKAGTSREIGTVIAGNIQKTQVRFGNQVDWYENSELSISTEPSEQEKREGR